MNWTDFPVFGGMLAGAAASGMLLGMVDESRKQKRRRTLLTSEISEAVRHSQPTWQQIVDLADLDGNSTKDAYFCVRKLYKDLLLGKAKDLEPHRELVETYISTRKQDEPFEGLPTETRVHLERLREAMSGKEQLLEPLTTQIRELVSVYERDKRGQRRYTVWGFFITAASLVFAAYTYFYPHVTT
jgi:hypothetical protein